MLKKFTDFANEKKQGEKVQKVQEPQVKEPKVKEVKKDIKKVEEPETPKNENTKPEIDFNFNGKIVFMTSNLKPSKSIQMLESKNISKDKLHYILSKPSNKSLVIVKYNEKANIKLTEFVNTLVSYYKKNFNDVMIFDEIVVEGSEHYSIIKNIPNLLIGGKKLIDVLNENFIKLLK